MPKLITVGNLKGGVGKTTVACHLGFAAAEAGHSVLVVDFDGQGNASQVFSHNLMINNDRGGAELLFENGPLPYRDSAISNLKLLHGHLHLDEIDKRGDEILALAIKLRAKIRALPFDYVIFDTPTALGPRVASPLFWSDTVVLTVEPLQSAVVALENTFKTIRDVQRVNKALHVQIVINQFRKSKSQDALRGALKEKFGRLIAEEFGMRTAVADAMENNLPVWKYAKRNKKLGQHWKSFSDRILDVTA
ncbi:MULTISPECIES: ParA family protein [unclassified Caballeronia]|uniref:ParA family protein n=1 Tax=unclassified Caballeronia TaxID=2646786 RepID=UPI00286773C6|nr:MULTISPECIES: ParA family protein [unclassified Caballeronia]MDR5777004.1 ParA family protein [Caballeronia sp. LZ002]MDR5852421.1 ParA family protein [Caballeronia sp. LZ003]